jgi:aerobic-type carbon monoxide dehydrogenase small subunit (CoxS/CutS family)
MPYAGREMADLKLQFELNGEPRRMKVDERDSLLEVLNRDLGLTGTREGCGIGVCGACTVLVDGTPQSACLLFAFQAEGRSIVTVEGLRQPDRVQQAFAAATAFQCSYCTPGFILATHALLSESRRIEADAAREYLSGNLCRCGSYIKILKAVMSLADS